MTKQALNIIIRRLFSGYSGKHTPSAQYGVATIVADADRSNGLDMLSW